MRSKRRNVIDDDDDDDDENENEEVGEQEKQKGKYVEDENNSYNKASNRHNPKSKIVEESKVN